MESSCWDFAQPFTSANLCLIVADMYELRLTNLTSVKSLLGPSPVQYGKATSHRLTCGEGTPVELVEAITRTNDHGRSGPKAQRTAGRQEWSFLSCKMYVKYANHKKLHMENNPPLKPLKKM